jgi:stalled ribosome rescue protein Dom34
MGTRVAVWIDQQEARVFHIHPETVDENTVLAPQHHIHRHPKGQGEPREHPDDQRRFFAEVARGLGDTDAILIVGPSSAKLELLRYLREHHHTLEAHVVGLETVDHPTDGQIVAHARHYFKARSNMGF